MLDISTAAWAVLLPTWAVRWALIFGIGSAPWLITRALRHFRRPEPARYPVFRQACAFAACCLAVWSFQLAADTFIVEGGQFDKLASKSCTLDAVPSEVRCEDGRVYRGVALHQDVRSGPGKLYLLPQSELPVYFGP